MKGIEEMEGIVGRNSMLNKSITRMRTATGKLVNVDGTITHLEPRISLTPSRSDRVSVVTPLFRLKDKDESSLALMPGATVLS